MKLRFAQHSEARLKELWEGGEISRLEILQDIQNAPEYFGNPATRIFILTQFRKLIAIKPLAGKPTAEQGHVVSQFADDLLSEELTYAEVDYALGQWRKSDRDFAPHSGNILTILKEAGYNRPSVSRAEFLTNRLRALIDPEFKPAEKRKHRGIRSGPPKLVERPPHERRKKQVERRPIIQPQTNKHKMDDMAEANRKQLLSVASETRIIDEKIGESVVKVAQALVFGKWRTIGREINQSDAEKLLKLEQDA